MVLALGLFRGHNQPVHQAGLSDGSKDSCPISSVWMLAGSLNASLCGPLLVEVMAWKLAMLSKWSRE